MACAGLYEPGPGKRAVDKNVRPKGSRCRLKAYGSFTCAKELEKILQEDADRGLGPDEQADIPRRWLDLCWRDGSRRFAHRSILDEAGRLYRGPGKRIFVTLREKVPRVSDESSTIDASRRFS